MSGEHGIRGSDADAGELLGRSELEQELAEVEADLEPAGWVVPVSEDRARKRELIEILERQRARLEKALR